ncbi:protein roadkill-like [Drosophila busckii]|uniref:protein roadkill-like n=1 Tax=Drosophila busckii TaxID=30019 RepID=UPI00143340E2|nr:protein roadkill-like [Drosophila busckii]
MKIVEKPNETVQKISSTTDIRNKVYQTNYTWTIKNAKVLWKFDKYNGLKSERFSADGGVANSYLKFHKADPDVFLEFHSSIETNYDSIINCILNIPALEYGKEFLISSIKYPFYLGSLSEINNKIEKIYIDKIIIYFELSIQQINGIENSADANFKPRIEKNNGKLLKELGDLLHDSKFTDVIIISADKKELRAHKLILAARSEVFKAMFSHELEENKLNEVSISDFDAEVIHEMLKYMYTEKLTKLNDLNADLLAIANKYELQELEQMCVDSLLEHLSIETAAEAFQLGDLYNWQILKDKAMIIFEQCTTNWLRKNAFQEPQVLKNIFEIIMSLPKANVAEESNGTAEATTHCNSI